MTTTTNIFIVSLSIADLLFLSFSIPIAIINLQNLDEDKFSISALSCRIVKWLEQFNMAGSILTMVAMSTERFLAIAYTLKAKALGVKSKTSALKAVSVVWLTGLCLSIPAYLGPETGWIIEEVTPLNPAMTKPYLTNDTTRIFGNFSDASIFENENSTWLGLLEERNPDFFIQGKNLQAPPFNITTLAFNDMKSFVEPSFVNNDYFGRKYLERVHINFKSTINFLPNQLFFEGEQAYLNESYLQNLIANIKNITDNQYCNFPVFTKDMAELPELPFSLTQTEIQKIYTSHLRQQLSNWWSSKNKHCMFYIDLSLYQLKYQSLATLVIYESIYFDIYHQNILSIPQLDQTQKELQRLKSRRFHHLVSNYTNLVPFELINFDKANYVNNGCVKIKPVCTFYPSIELTLNRRIYQIFMYIILYVIPALVELRMSIFG